MGLEVSARIKLGYQFLCDSYEPGDEIYLFGFSRGAFEARSLASFVTLFGIARKDGDFSFEKPGSSIGSPTTGAMSMPSPA